MWYMITVSPFNSFLQSNSVFGLVLELSRYLAAHTTGDYGGI
jgi:hypothetical protein